MNIRDRFMAAYRAFKLGPGLDQALTHWGVDPGAYSPPEYGEYIATSNNVYAVATQRAQMLAGLPLKLYRGVGDKRKEVKTGQLYELLHRVNPRWTFSRLLQMTELSLCLWGTCYWFLERGQRGTMPPQEIWWGRPDRVTVMPDPIDYIAGFAYQAPNGQVLPFAPSEVIWLRYPNPVDEYSGLSPLAAARLAADVASAAMQSNRNVFTNGLQLGGTVMPKSGTTLTQEQAKELELQLERRFRGIDKAHRWGVFRFEAQLQALGLTPKDAEFLGALNFSLEEICRAYHWPIDLVGGQRTYENVNAAHKAAWTHCLIPEASFIATELTEQLLPMFGTQADAAEFDSSDIEVLHEDTTAAWVRANAQIERGVLTINEWRSEQGLEPVAWGDVWWAPSTVTPIESAEKPEPPAPVTPPAQEQPVDEEPAQDESQEEPRAHQRATQGAAWEYGGAAHRRVWARFVRRADRYERMLTEVVQALFKQQQDSVVARVGGKREEPALPDDFEPFDMAEWVRKFRTKVKAVLLQILEDSGGDALDELAIGMAFDVKNPAVAQFLEDRAQRFAELVNETTWKMLKDSLGEGMDKGESIPDLIKRVIDVMGERIRSTPENIARTEVIGASNGATLEAWKQSGVVKGKVWLAALDDRTRETHVEAHGQERALDEDFEVGAGSGPAPGQIGLAEEDCMCRCTMTAIIG